MTINVRTDSERIADLEERYSRLIAEMERHWTTDAIVSNVRERHGEESHFPELARYYASQDWIKERLRTASFRVQLVNCFTFNERKRLREQWESLSLEEKERLAQPILDAWDSLHERR